MRRRTDQDFLFSGNQVRVTLVNANLGPIWGFLTPSSKVAQFHKAATPLPAM
jgi:hypothetical protein